MATQVTAFPLAQEVPNEELRQIFSICDHVINQQKNGEPLVVEVTHVLALGYQVVETLRRLLEELTTVRFELNQDAVAGAAILVAVEPMPFGPPANSDDPTGGLTAALDAGSSVSASTPSAIAAASTHTKTSAEKISRPKNAFMIYRLDLHATMAAQNPGMHNNDISKIIGARWRAEKPHVIEAYKKRAEEEKRQHAIDHPGYRYQPRKPSEKKKRMTKNKLAKLAAKSSSTDTTTDATTLPAQSDANNQISEIGAQSRNVLQSEQIPVDTFMLPYPDSTSQLTSHEGSALAEIFVGAGGDDELRDQLALFNSQHLQLQAIAAASGSMAAAGTDEGAMPHSSPNEVSDSDATNTVAPLSAVWAVDATTIRESALTPDAFAEQGRQERLEADFNAFINDAVLLPGSIPDDFAPADDWVPVIDNAL
ncbi:hypothetical protein AC578_25 [Pseudocercospora eumusae]|uniref:HMG box domain-containing protein n=1 Tax=Pseudocercospora eumusae TaxID=321146 RepID=A0A139H4A7_9PEZI|nr:hypothetical protein AC578_25 [Pseudocercospora eumusae]